MDDRFFNAYFPGSVSVCGRELKDFSSYHYMMLRAIKSPIVDRDGINRPCDLLAAIAVCRNKFEQDAKIKPSWKDVFWRWRMDRSKSLFSREIRKFASWMEAHSNGPRFWKIISGGPSMRELTGPDLLTLVVPVMMKIGISEAEAWNMSVGRLQWISAQINEIEGSTMRFLYDEDLEDGEDGLDA